MGTFFQGWRRKAGCITLVLACVFMAGWVRSQSVNDLTKFHLSECWMYVIESDQTGLRYRTLIDFRSPDADRSFSWQPVPTRDVLYQPAPLMSLHQDRLWNNCLVLATEEFPFVFVTFLQLPYGVIVVPLALLSAWLLLSKRQTTIAKPNAINDK